MGALRFSNAELQEILLSRGIEWHKSSLHALEQNGIAERNVRTVIEKMRVLHIQSALPLRHWPLILTAAINILNMIPNKVAPKSPYYAEFERLPNILILNSFGCQAFWLEPDQKKLISKAKEGIYVGTEFSGGHIILNPTTGRTVIRRDIRVHDDVFPYRNKILSLKSNNRHVIHMALSRPRAKDWNKAIDIEIENMTRNNVWTLVPRSEAKDKVMTVIWSLKENPDGQLKARWCARGFSEPYANNTYADVLPPTTMRMLFALAASRNLNISHVDITVSFLHAEIDTPLYIEQPHGREKPGNLICKLKKLIDGLKTAPRK
ncbi:putative serine threonine protein kinase domain protein [Erysiphe necator]|uniref:Putative serine threonine protein kinase domain protein n=1 Tax=Uncinula necator TaxID=52586 RepID=A0A0B1PBF3_UNCNE|nr:putative serine threonine protein kinase domain protein [Erysiphe necator]